VEKVEKSVPLSKSHPHLAEEAFGWNPEDITAGSVKKLPWKCSKKHVFHTSPNQRTRKSRHTERGHKNGTGCPYCANQSVLVGYNDLETTHPELSRDATGWDPKKVVPGSAKKVEWKCKQGHTWFATVVSRTRQSTGCPYCNNVKVLSGFNDLLTLFPKISSEAEGWDPSKVSPGSKAKLAWRCSSNHVWTTSVDLRTKRDFGCPYCSHQKVLAGFNDLATTHPAIAREAIGWKTNSVTAANQTKAKWSCQLGHIYESRIRDRAQRGTSCIYCSGKSVLFGFNDLSTTHPELAKEACGWDPKTVSSGSSSKKYLWKCPQGHTWKSVVANRIRENSGCPYCKNKTLLSGYNDLKTKNPRIATEADGWDPSNVLVGSGKKLKWKCGEGHTWTATVISRTSEHATGCPTCAKYGFDPNSDGYLYFLEHNEWDMYQIGITNNAKVRLKKHQQRGWVCIDIRGPMDGLLARQWEQAILKMLKNKGADLTNNEVAGKFDGYSESWSKSKFIARSIRELMEFTENYELGKD
jgi:hypothetical protein